MKFTIDIGKKYIWVLSVLLIGVLVVAFGTTDPATFGHDVGELDLGILTIDTGNSEVDVAGTVKATTFELGDGTIISSGSDVGKWSDDTAGGIYYADNVGIGTDSPSKPLHVKTSDGGETALFETESSENSRIQFKSGTGEVNIGVGSSLPHGYIWSSTDDFFIGDEANPTLYVDGMNCDGGLCKVGIGTSSPEQKLHIAGAVKASSFVDDDANYYADLNSGANVGGVWYFNSNVVLQPQDSGYEGGELDLMGSGSYQGWALDNYAGRVRFHSGGNEYFAIHSDGHTSIGIGSDYCGYKLCVGGAVWTLAGVLAVSDLRLKKNIVPMESTLDKVMKLEGVEFEWKEDLEVEYPEGKQIGIIAQELEKEFPELVSTDSRGYKSVDYNKLSVVLLEAIKEQQKQIDELKAKLD